MNPVLPDGSVDTRSYTPETPKGFIQIASQDGTLTLAINGILSIGYSKNDYTKAFIITHRRVENGQNESLTATISHDDVLKKINEQLLPGQQFPDTTFADK